MDPAELDPSVVAIPNVAHVPQMINAAHSTIQQLLTAQAWRKHAPPAEGHASAPSCTNFTDNSTENSAENSAKDSVKNDAEPLAVNTAPDSATDCGATDFKLDFAADLLVSDMNAEPEVVVDVLLSALGAGLVKPGALVVATFKDFCGRQKRMRDEVCVCVEYRGRYSSTVRDTIFFFVRFALVICGVLWRISRVFRFVT